MMYKCDADCGYESKSWFGICPRCKQGMGVESETTVTNSVSKSIPGSTQANPEMVERWDRKSIDPNNKSDVVVKKTKYSSLNRILSTGEGFVDEQVILLGSQPGIGKSTLCAEISDNDTIYIGTEESYNQINNRFLRVNPSSKAGIVSVTQVDTILDIIERDDSKLVIIDSLNNINNGADGYVRSANNLNRIVKAIKNKGKIGIIISQVTKGGEISGMNTIIHSVDTVMYLERSLTSDNLILSSTKNRFGEIGSIAIFEHTKDGLQEIGDSIERDPNAIGVTYTQAKFGYRKIGVAVEALVAPSSLNFGLRKANGVSMSRFQQILGVLAYNDRGSNYGNKDIYVSISNGLTINDTKIDLAIANSILSSYYGKPSVLDSEEVIGEFSLNGSIRGNANIKHIKDLIDIYKNK